MESPIVEHVEITTSEQHGPATCVAVCNDGQRITLPIKGFSKSYEKGALSEANLVLFGFRVKVVDDGTPSPFTTHIPARESVTYGQLDAAKDSAVRLLA